MNPKYNTLTDTEARIILRGGTEPPFSGAYDAFYKDGMYVCRQCDNPLFSSRSKFDAGCGWPSFDDSFPGSITRLPDPDGERVELRCAVCGGHLGHTFTGEHMTESNVRHCVNSLSIRFIPDNPTIAEKQDG